jgi:twitching motility two-component system response regulator PilG
VYSVAVIGFTSQERILLQSIFNLTAKRIPKYLQHIESSGTLPDISLIDGDSPQFVKQFFEGKEARSTPSIVVGAFSFGTNSICIPRPLQWSRLLKTLDQIVNEQLMDDAFGLDLNSQKRKAVLVVDDSPSVRLYMDLYMGKKLTPYNIKLDFAETGEQAIGLTVDNKYLCVFLDVMMPGADGYQVCKVIKSNKDKENTASVIMLTSKSSPFDRIRGTMAGCDAYLTKPLDETKLSSVINKFILARASLSN